MSIDGFRTPRATCLLAPNPSPMTLDGTNTWLIAEPGSSSVVVVDPGPEDEGHLRRVHAEAVAGDRRVARILLTHGHPDHSAGAARFSALTGAPVQAADPAQRLGPEGLADGDVVTAAGCELRVVATPGHSGDSVCLLLTADHALLTGDTVLGRGTTVIARDGNLGDYLRTLGQLRDLAEATEVSLLLPGHGPTLADPLGTLDYYISHRAERLDQVRSALAAGAKTLAEIVALIYTGVDPSVWPAAEWSVRAQLDYLNSLGGNDPPQTPPAPGGKPSPQTPLGAGWPARLGGLPPPGRLAGAFAEALGVQDEDGTGRDLQPAAGGEVGQRLVDRLPGGPDQLGQFLLGEIVMNVQAVAFLLAEPVGQVEQVLRHASGNVGEDQVGHHVIGPPQPPGQRLQHVHGYLGPLEQPGAQRVVGERRDRRVGDGAGRRGPRPRIEERELAEHLGRSQYAQQVLAAVGGRPGELELAVEHDVQAISVLPFKEKVLAAGQLDL
jgi:glyoxylase-like metal-dependent hydrolase (beta-lactamase superfamily II)